MKAKIFETLIKLGVPCHLSGFDYTQAAVNLLVGDYKTYRELTKNLYPKIAEIYGTTPTRVERAIRHAKEKMLDSGVNSDICDYFGAHGKITNGQFLTTIARRVQMDETA